VCDIIGIDESEEISGRNKKKGKHLNIGKRAAL
jgi:hypothetical protein